MLMLLRVMLYNDIIKYQTMHRKVCTERYAQKGMHRKVCTGTLIVSGILKYYYVFVCKIVPTCLCFFISSVQMDNLSKQVYENT